MRSVNEWIVDIGIAAARLCDLRALEGAAGNVSLFVPADVAGLDALLEDRWMSRREFTIAGGVSLPPGALIISGTGRRLSDIVDAPDSVLCAIVITPDGQAILQRAERHAVEPTSEIDSHLGIHAAVLGNTPDIHAVIHAQPPQITYLSHIPAYRDEPRLNRQLLRWQPETLAMLPEGLRMLPFETPGTVDQGRKTMEATRTHRLLIWAKHGVVARSRGGASSAADLIDYVEAAAGYEVTDLLAGRPADGLSLDELRSIAERFDVPAALLGTLPRDVLR
jgi:rhamnulose-1-phosphate aldolase